MNKRKNKPLKRSVYLIEKLGYAPGFLRYKRLIKIGVSNDPERRLSEIRSAYPGRFTLIHQTEIRAATRKEAALHREYKEHNYPVYGKDGKSSEEFFKLTNRQIRQVKYELKGGIDGADWAIYFAALFIAVLIGIKYAQDL